MALSRIPNPAEISTNYGYLPADSINGVCSILPKRENELATDRLFAGTSYANILSGNNVASLQKELELLAQTVENIAQLGSSAVESNLNPLTYFDKKTASVPKLSDPTKLINPIEASSIYSFNRFLNQLLDSKYLHSSSYGDISSSAFIRKQSNIVNFINEVLSSKQFNNYLYIHLKLALVAENPNVRQYILDSLLKLRAKILEYSDKEKQLSLTVTNDNKQNIISKIGAYADFITYNLMGQIVPKYDALSIYKYVLNIKANSGNIRPEQLTLLKPTLQSYILFYELESYSSIYRKEVSRRLLAENLDKPSNNVRTSLAFLASIDASRYNRDGLDQLVELAAKNPICYHFANHMQALPIRRQRNITYGVETIRFGENRVTHASLEESIESIIASSESIANKEKYLTDICKDSMYFVGYNHAMTCATLAANAGIYGPALFIENYKKVVERQPESDTKTAFFKKYSHYRQNIDLPISNDSNLGVYTTVIMLSALSALAGRLIKYFRFNNTTPAREEQASAEENEKEKKLAQKQKQKTDLAKQKNTLEDALTIKVDEYKNKTLYKTNISEESLNEILTILEKRQKRHWCYYNPNNNRDLAKQKTDVSNLLKKIAEYFDTEKKQNILTSAQEQERKINETIPNLALIISIVKGDYAGDNLKACLVDLNLKLELDLSDENIDLFYNIYNKNSVKKDLTLDESTNLNSILSKINQKISSLTNKIETANIELQKYDNSFLELKNKLSEYVSNEEQSNNKVQWEGSTERADTIEETLPDLLKNILAEFIKNKRQPKEEEPTGDLTPTPFGIEAIYDSEDDLPIDPATIPSPEQAKAAAKLNQPAAHADDEQAIKEADRRLAIADITREQENSRILTIAKNPFMQALKNLHKAWIDTKYYQGLDHDTYNRSLIFNIIRTCEGLVRSAKGDADSGQGFVVKNAGFGDEEAYLSEELVRTLKTIKNALMHGAININFTDFKYGTEIDKIKDFINTIYNKIYAPFLSDELVIQSLNSEINQPFDTTTLCDLTKYSLEPAFTAPVLQQTNQDLLERFNLEIDRLKQFAQDETKTAQKYDSACFSIAICGEIVRHGKVEANLRKTGYTQEFLGKLVAERNQISHLLISDSYKSNTDYLSIVEDQASNMVYYKHKYLPIQRFDQVLDPQKNPQQYVGKPVSNSLLDMILENKHLTPNSDLASAYNLKVRGAAAASV